MKLSKNEKGFKEQSSLNRLEKRSFSKSFGNEVSKPFRSPKTSKSLEKTKFFQKLTNNKVAFLAIMLMLISLICNTIIYQKTTIYITGKATTEGYINICINRPPVLNEFPPSLRIKAGETCFYDINATDIDNLTQNLTFYDNTSLFDINPKTGIINFTIPIGANEYHFLITVEDNSTCANSNHSQTLIIISNIAPSITSYYPDEDPTINETETQPFNITYEDDNNDSLVVYWYINNSLVSTFNDTSNISKSNYTFIGNYTNAGTYNVKVVVSDSLLNDSHSWTLTVTNVNRPPSFIRTIKDQTWAEDTILYGLDLDDYSYDPDPDDTLSYSVNYLTDPHSITVTINDENVVTFSQPANWYGSENISFNVTDTYGASNTSNNITLTVYDVEEPPPTVIREVTLGPGRIPECIEQWLCTYWSVCYPDGFRKRTCTDLSECGTEYYKPLEIQNCTYIPSCFNGIQDGDETEIDCGGKCGPCPTCFDGIMNYDETGIDCGGSCPPCPTCFDGIINGGEIGIDCGGACELQDCCINGYRDAHLGEIGIDCGGPCKPCEVEIEIVAPIRFPWLILIIILGITILLSIIIYLNYRERIKLLFLLITKRFKKEAPPSKGNVILFTLNKLEKEIELKGVEIALKEFLATLKSFLMGYFKIKHEFTYEHIISIIKENKLEATIKSILIRYIKRIIHIAYSGYRISKEELILLKKELRIIVLLITKPPEEGTKGEYIKEKEIYKSELQKFYVTLSKSLFMLENKETEKAKKLFFYSKEIYNRLLPEEKKEATNHIIRIEKEINLFEKKAERKKRTKDMTVLTISLIMLLFLGSMDIFFGSNITGLFVFEGENISEEINAQFLIDIHSFNIEVGQHFVYRIRGYDKEEETLLFSDDTKLFNISSKGIIDFTPTKDKLGVHHVTLIIKDRNFKTSFKDVIFNITKEGVSEREIETSTKINETEEIINETTEINQTEEINLTLEVNETEEVINETQELNETEEEINITTEINETEEEINISSIKQTLNESENITEQLSANFLLKPLNAYVTEFELGSSVKFNILAENNGTREIEDAYFKILVQDNNGSIIDVQSTPITIASKEKKEMIALWNTKNITIGNYEGKLVIMYENKTSEYDIRINIAPNEIQTEIIGITGMVTSPSSVVKIQSYTNIPPILIWIILIIILIDIAWFLFYSRNKKK